MGKPYIYIIIKLVQKFNWSYKKNVYSESLIKFWIHIKINFQECVNKKNNLKLQNYMSLLIKSDFLRYRKTFNLYYFLIIYLKNPEFRFLFYFRLCSKYRAYNLIGFFGRIYLNILKHKFGIQIPIPTKIGKGFHLNHYGGIIVNQGVKLGDNCNISQGVTIGNVSRGKLKGCPIIGDRVWIGANSVVVGKISIGNDVLIAPLSYVNFDVPDNAVVSGNPAQIVSYNSSAVYIKNIV